VTLALDDDAFEDLRPAPGPLDHLEVDADAIAGVKRWYTAKLGSLQAVDHSAHALLPAAPEVFGGEA
jgi:hypothetical protein